MAVDDEELQSWREILAEDPRGWAFDDLRGYAEDAAPWRFDTLARSLVQMSHDLLDIGTGGGEFLAALSEDLPEVTAATESQAQNLSLARERLEPLGVKVAEHDPRSPGAALPFASESFDLVLDRHAAFSSPEVARVLAPGGIFLTQQVGADDLAELIDLFGLQTPFPDSTLEHVERELTEAGLRIERSGAFRGRALFSDMPSLLRYLRRVPWTAPEDLSVDAHRDQLEDLAARIADGPLVLATSRFWIQARRPEAPEASVTDFSRLLDDLPTVPEV